MNCLFDDYVSAAAVLDRIRTQPHCTEPVRKAAMEMVSSRVENPELVNWEAWQAVPRAGTAPRLLSRYLRRMERLRACTPTVEATSRPSVWPRIASTISPRRPRPSPLPKDSSRSRPTARRRTASPTSPWPSTNSARSRNASAGRLIDCAGNGSRTVSRRPAPGRGSDGA